MITAVYRIHCDAPACDASETTGRTGELPASWTRLRSTAHIVIPAPVYRGAARQSQAIADRTSGSFALDLCPSHPDAFDGHHPRTEGRLGMGGSSRPIDVSCECGASLGWTRTGPLDDMPTPEHLWRQHLPAELRACAADLRTADR